MLPYIFVCIDVHGKSFLWGKFLGRFCSHRYTSLHMIGGMKLNRTRPRSKAKTSRPRRLCVVPSQPHQDRLDEMVHEQRRTMRAVIEAAIDLAYEKHRLFKH